MWVLSRVTLLNLMRVWCGADGLFSPRCRTGALPRTPRYLGTKDGAMGFGLSFVGVEKGGIRLS